MQHALLPVVEASASDALFRMPPGEEGPVVYLTIDDGPSPSTPAILDMLSRRNATATFFVHTDHILGGTDEDVLRRAVREGHHLANHMPADETAKKLLAGAFAEELLEADARLAELSGTPPLYFRPPRGAYSALTMTGVLEETGYVAADGDRRLYVMASFVPWDAGGLTDTPFAPFNRAVGHHYADDLGRALFDGAIVVFHDGPRTRRTATTLHSLERFLQRAEERGFDVRALPQPH